MEQVTLYVKKILALLLSFFVFVLAYETGLFNSLLSLILLAAGAFLLFAYLDFRTTGDKPRFLFGLNQSDTFLNQKGGFWNLFKWIVTLFGLLYDLVVWSLWGVFLLFVLFSDLLLLIKTIVYWIIHAVIWFIRQLFPPFVFMFRMFIHYLVNWVWWIYQLSVRNLKTSINRNFYFIALWGTVPAVFVVFLFYAISQIVGVPELIAISAVFALVPLVWAYGEIAALRFEKREKESYSAVQSSFRNGFEAVKSVIFYIIITIFLIATEIILNLLGWIPNLSMSILGITLNLNMAFSFLLVFLAVILIFASQILPTHILHHPGYDNNLNSTLGFLNVIGKKFLRYTFVELPAGFFGSILLVIPVTVMLIAFTLTDSIKDKVLNIRIEQLSEKTNGMEALDAYRAENRIQRMELYKDMPLIASSNFIELANSGNEIEGMEDELVRSKDQLLSRKVDFDVEIADLSAEIDRARASGGSAEEITMLSSNRLDAEEEYLDWESDQKEGIAFLEEDLRELKRLRAQMPILYFFIGILISVFGGIVLAVYISYMGNIYFELYSLREDGKPSYWIQTLNNIRKKDPNQPLLGFTFLVFVAIGLMAILNALGIVNVPL
ncbi:MAG: hypothetical protein K9J30_01540 [Bacteroidales bacterium]|nr:hypothetical protein [Bacteroidales bacterium]